MEKIAHFFFLIFFDISCISAVHRKILEKENFRNKKENRKILEKDYKKKKIGKF
jgi:hypothetical protein